MADTKTLPEATDLGQPKGELKWLNANIVIFGNILTASLMINGENAGLARQIPTIARTVIKAISLRQKKIVGVENSKARKVLYNGRNCQSIVGPARRGEDERKKKTS